MARAKRTDPGLWERVKAEITDSDRGGRPGQWSARKAQMAVQDYKRRGGGYDDSGPSRKDTHLHEWTAEEWGTKSGAGSLESGERYLPKRVLMLLTEDEYRRTTEKKRRDTKDRGRQHSGQPAGLDEKAHRIRRDGPSRKDLDLRARELGIAGRSKMSEQELIGAIERATDGHGRARRAKGGGADDLRRRTKAELGRMARERGIEGRSGMNRDELAEALAGAGGGGAGDGGEPGGRTKSELYALARERGVEGRSRMSREELASALGRD